MASKLTRSYLPELSASIFGRRKPAMVTVNLTNQCNQNCIYCEIGQKHQPPGPEALTFSDLTWILDEMAKNKIRKISLCGGEPFLFEGIIDLVDYAGRKNIRCSITTNGMTAYMLNDSELNILKECKTEINISIDSFRESVQNYTRSTPAALPHALKSIQKLSEKTIPVTVLTVISKYNYQELFNFFSLACEKGIKQVLFQPVIYYSNYPERPPVDNKSLLNVSAGELDILMGELHKILRFERSHTIKSNVYRILPWIRSYLETAENQDRKWFFDDVLYKFYCREIYAIIDISYDGGIQPCALTNASISIHHDRHLGLIGLWLKATEVIKDDLDNGRFYAQCNGCCNHFSRNMLASIINHPVKNRAAMMTIMPLILSRIMFVLFKNLYFYRRQTSPYKNV
jgi:MoaA/NifB/PqqE/SkfB family radical SAM enzyme